jgi:hypothetical protein
MATKDHLQVAIQKNTAEMSGCKEMFFTNKEDS